MRWGIAATGSIALRFVEALRQTDGAEIVAVGSRTQGRADEFGDAHGIPGRHGTYEALASDPDVDVVYVASPQSRHCADTLGFLRAGKHVLCEKPLALDAAQARQMADTARRSGRFLMEAIWTRFLPTYVTLRELLAEGRIGEIRLVEADFGFAMPFDPTHRLFDRAIGGGAMLDLGVYPTQLAFLVLGAPGRVVAAGHVGPSGVDEQAAAVYHHDGGALSVVKAAIRTRMSCTATITGTDGVIELPAFMHCPDSLTVRTRSGDEVIERPVEGEGLRYQVEEVHRCIAAGELESPVMPLDESCAIAAVLESVLTQVGVTYPDAGAVS